VVVVATVVVTAPVVAAVAAAVVVIAVAAVFYDIAAGVLSRPSLFFNTPAGPPILFSAPQAPAPPANAGPQNNLQPFNPANNPPQAQNLVQDANNVIAAANQANTDALNGNQGQAVPDFNNLVAALKPTAADFDAAVSGLGLNESDLSLNQSSIDSIQSEIAQSGFPSAFQETLGSVGLTPTEIQNLGNYMSSTPVNLAVPSVTPDQVFGAAGSLSLATPEPMTLISATIGILLCAMCAWLQRRRVAAGGPDCLPEAVARKRCSPPPGHPVV
jgi:hypothetical protein